MVSRTRSSPYVTMAKPGHNLCSGFSFVFHLFSGIFFVNASQRRRKVRSTSFPATACGYCRKLRSLPCASFQIRSTLASDLFFLLRTAYRSRRRFFVPNKRHLSLTSSLLLSKLNPLRWASIWGHTTAKVKLRSRLASEFFIRRGRFGLRSSTGGCQRR